MDLREYAELHYIKMFLLIFEKYLRLNTNNCKKLPVDVGKLHPESLQVLLHRVRKKVILAQVKELLILLQYGRQSSHVSFAKKNKSLYKINQLQISKETTAVFAYREEKIENFTSHIDEVLLHFSS